MKKTTLLVSILAFLALSACQGKTTIIEEDPEAGQATDPVSESSNAAATLGLMTQKIGEMKQKYINPKQATLRRADSSKAGILYMKYDKATDTTYVWAELTDLTEEERKGTYSISLHDELKPETVNLGTVVVDENGVGVLYFEFDEKGNQYRFLRGVVKDGEKEVFTAQFSVRLS